MLFRSLRECVAEQREFKHFHIYIAYGPLLSVYLPDIRFYRPDLPPFVDTYIYDTANRQEHGDVPRRNLGKKRPRV